MEKKVETRNMKKEDIDALFSSYKQIGGDAAKYVFCRLVEERRQIVSGQLWNRMELELVWEDFSKNGIDSEYDPERELDLKPRVPIAPPKPKHTDESAKIALLRELYDDEEDLVFLLSLLEDVRYCKYCKSLGFDNATYLSHTLQSSSGNILCPNWRSYRYAPLIDSARSNSSRPSKIKKFCK